MGNSNSRQQGDPNADPSVSSPSAHDNTPDNGSSNSKFRAFPGSAILEKTFCGSIDTTDPSEYEDVGLAKRLLRKADLLCVSSPTESTTSRNEPFYEHHDATSPTLDRSTQVHPSSAMLARALVSEVTDNPATLPAKDMTEREYKLLKAQQAAAQLPKKNDATSPRPVGTNGPGVGPPNVMKSLAHAVLGDDAPTNLCQAPSEAKKSGMMSTFTGGRSAEHTATVHATNPHRITVGLSLSRRDGEGHPDTVTRQTAFDFNELQDRSYKYVSSTDMYGWRAGGGERGGPVIVSEEVMGTGTSTMQPPKTNTTQQQQQQQVKQPCTDTVHIDIIELDCPDAATVDQVIHALASGEIFIPHMTVLPEALSVNGSSPPDLIVKFGCERNDDIPIDEWPNWCLEFLHNQLYEYFYHAGAKWTTRPFNITLARKVRWKTVKHMNRYFAHAERVIDMWREKGPQYLDPQLTYIEGGATPEEVARPHGIYLFRNGVPTNYFCPNFDPPYTTKMTRSLLHNVLQKSWDKRRREWTSQPIPKLITPVELFAAACGCTDPTAGGGFLATQVTSVRPAVSKEEPYTVAAQAASPVVATVPAPTPAAATVPAETHEDEQRDAAEPLSPRQDEQPQSSPPLQQRQYSAEEKKTDDVRDQDTAAQQPQQPPRTRNKMQHNSRQQSSGSMDQDMRSEYGTSVAMSGTTVMHTNLTSNRQLYSDEDWDSSDPPGARVMSPQWAKQSKQVNQELQRQMERIANAQIESGVAAEKVRHAKNLELAQAFMDREKAKASPGAVRPNDSGFSLEYSTDGSSILFHQEVSSPATQEPASTKTESTTAAKAMDAPVTDMAAEDESSALSLQESVSSSVMSAVPTDEELFAVGWAKALDPNSGNYYYFTLDRSKIVWENPLSQRHSTMGEPFGA